MGVGDWLTLVGLLVVFIQLVQVGRVSSATVDALETAAERVGSYSILSLIPELKRVEMECERAARSQQQEESVAALREWNDVASRLRGFAMDRTDMPAEFTAALEDSIRSACRAKDSVLSGDEDPYEATRTVRDSMTAVIDHGRTLAAQMQVTAPVIRAPRTFRELVADSLSRFSGRSRP